MAKSRMLNTMIWKDEYFRGLSADEKLGYIYLLNNRFINYYGAFEAGVDMLAADLGQTLETVTCWLNKFESDGKIIRSDFWIAVLYFVEHQKEAVLNDVTKKALTNNKYQIPVMILDVILRMWGMEGLSESLMQEPSKRCSEYLYEGGSEGPCEGKDKIEKRKEKGEEEKEPAASSHPVDSTPTETEAVIREGSSDVEVKLSREFGKEFLGYDWKPLDGDSKAKLRKVAQQVEKIANKGPLGNIDECIKWLIVKARQYTKERLPDGKFTVGNLASPKFLNEYLSQCVKELYAA